MSDQIAKLVKNYWVIGSVVVGMIVSWANVNSSIVRIEDSLEDIQVRQSITTDKIADIYVSVGKIEERTVNYGEIFKKLNISYLLTN